MKSTYITEIQIEETQIKGMLFSSRKHYSLKVAILNYQKTHDKIS